MSDTPQTTKNEAPENKPVELVLSSSPHVRTTHSIENAMYMVILALLPALFGAFVFFGFEAFRVTFFCVAGCLAFEALGLKMNGIKNFRQTLFDGSAILTGILLAMNLPASAPWWLCLIGAFVAMIIAKHVFGGIGCNPFNPALVARIFLLIAWPARMTHWLLPINWKQYQGRFFDGLFSTSNPDALTGATPLGVLKTDGLETLRESFALQDIFMGNIGGSLGETSALLLLIGGIFLIARRVIRWEIPVAYIGSFFLLSAIAWAIKPDAMANPFFHLAAGGLFLGAFFMATDYVTSPMSAPGMLIFGLGCGILTFVIRYFGAFPEGVSFAIVIMNAFVPLIDRYIVPRRIGLRELEAAQENQETPA